MGSGDTSVVITNSAVVGDEWSYSHPDRFNPRKELGHPHNMKFHGPQNWCRLRGKVNKILLFS
jgi:hypothetical protein